MMKITPHGHDMESADGKSKYFFRSKFYGADTNAT